MRIYRKLPKQASKISGYQVEETSNQNKQSVSQFASLMQRWNPNAVKKVIHLLESKVRIQCNVKKEGEESSRVAK